MKIIFDPHTHTVFSHGSGTVEQNVEAAILKGLSSVAIADHGFGHLAYGIKNADAYLSEIERVKKAYAADIDVLKSVELNLLSFDGEVDLPKDYENAFDIKLMGFHKFARFGRGGLHFLLPKSTSKSAIEKNTLAYTNAIKSGKIDVITHIGYGLPCDKLAVARCAAEHNVLLEINAKHPEFTADELKQCAQTGVKFIVGSDAHSPQRVGDFSAALERIAAAGMDEALIVNARKAVDNE